MKGKKKLKRDKNRKKKKTPAIPSVFQDRDYLIGN